MDIISGSAQVDRFCFSYQYEVVCFGFGIAVMCCQLLQHFIAFCMGDTYRYRNDTSKLKHVSIRCRFFSCVLRESGRLLPPTHLRGRCCTQRTEVPALVMRFSVQLLHRRAATTPSSLNTVKKKNRLHRWRYLLCFSSLFIVTTLFYGRVLALTVVVWQHLKNCPSTFSSIFFGREERQGAGAHRSIALPTNWLVDSLGGEPARWHM